MKKKDKETVNFREAITDQTKEFFEGFKSEKFELKPYIVCSGKGAVMATAIAVINKSGKRMVNPLLTEFTLMQAPITSDN